MSKRRAKQNVKRDIPERLTMLPSMTDKANYEKAVVMAMIQDNISAA